MVSKLLLTIQLCPKTEFQPSARFGEDLSDSTWEYVCAIDLLCCHQRWVWTHDNIIRYGCFPDSGWALCIVKQSVQRLELWFESVLLLRQLNCSERTF